MRKGHLKIRAEGWWPKSASCSASALARLAHARLTARLFEDDTFCENLWMNMPNRALPCSTYFVAGPHFPLTLADENAQVGFCWINPHSNLADEHAARRWIVPRARTTVFPDSGG